MPGKGYLRVDAGAACRITGENTAWAMTLVKYLFGGLLEKNENAPCTLSVTEDASIGVFGAYCLEIGERISIRAAGKEGLAYALQTLFSIGRKTEAGMEALLPGGKGISRRAPGMQASEAYWKDSTHVV